MTAKCRTVQAPFPYAIKEAEVILAYQYVLKNPKSFPGFGGAGGDAAPAGTYIKRQKIDVLEIEYDQFNEQSVQRRLQRLQPCPPSSKNSPG